MAALSTILARIRLAESNNNYTLTPQQNVGYPRSHASGAYQFQPGTWQSYTQQSGIGTQYPQAYQAPPAVQDAVAAWVVTNKGLGDWESYSGPYGQVTSIDVTPQSIIATGGLSQAPGGGASLGSGTTPGMSIDAGPEFNPADPTTSDQPINSSTFNPLFSNPSALPGGSSDTFNPLFSNPGVDPTSGTVGDTSGTGTIGTGTTAQQQPSNVPGTTGPSWWTQLFDILGGYAQRGGVAILGIIFVAIGIWALVKGKIQLELPKGIASAASRAE